MVKAMDENSMMDIDESSTNHLDIDENSSSQINSPYYNRQNNRVNIQYSIEILSKNSIELYFRRVVNDRIKRLDHPVVIWYLPVNIVNVFLVIILVSHLVK